MVVAPGTQSKAPLVEEVIVRILLHPRVLRQVPPVYRLATTQLVPLSLPTKPSGTVENRVEVLFRKKSIPQPLGIRHSLCTSVLVLPTTPLKAPEWRSTLTMDRLSFRQLTTLVVVARNIRLGRADGFVSKPYISVTANTLPGP